MSKIQWTDETWNPVRGCSLVSAGCKRCYAMKTAHRFSGPGDAYEDLTELGPDGPRWTGKIRTVPEKLAEPLHWRKPRRVFVNSMSDLFHEDVPDEFIDRVFAVMALSPRHTFQILTKRPERMREYFERGPMGAMMAEDALLQKIAGVGTMGSEWPLPNVWLGVSAEDQKTADERIPLLLQTPAAVRFVSAEPLLGSVRLDRIGVPDTADRQDGPWMLFWNALTGFRPTSPYSGTEGNASLDWVIVGGESGPGARPLDVTWARSIVDQCKVAAVPVFVKQLGANVVDRNDQIADFWPDNADGTDRDTEDLTANGWQGDPVRVLLKDRKGGDPSEWPEDLRVREFPATQRAEEVS